jgi:hypothetical protein
MAPNTATNPLVEAADRSLAADGARIFICEAAAGTQPTTWEIGTAEPRRRRLHVRRIVTAENPMARQLERIAAASKREVSPPPWAEGEASTGERVLIGSHVYSKDNGTWWSPPPREMWPIDGLWALEVARAAQSVESVGADEVRGVATTSYRGIASAADAVALPDNTLVQTPSRANAFGTMEIAAWIDAAGTIRRIACDPLGTPKRRGLRRPSVTFERVVIELWDYGTTPEIEAPLPSQAEPGNV